MRYLQLCFAPSPPPAGGGMVNYNKRHVGWLGCGMIGCMSVRGGGEIIRAKRVCI